MKEKKTDGKGTTRTVVSRGYGRADCKTAVYHDADGNQ